MKEKYQNSPLGHQSEAYDRNSVFFQISDDGGTTWTSPSVVQHSAEHPAHFVKTLVDNDGVIHLLWIQSLDDGGFGSENVVIRHVRSADNGATWSRPEDLASGWASRMQGIVDNCGTLHVLYQHGMNTPAIHIDYATNSGGKWSKAEHMFSNLDVADFAMERSQNDQMLMVLIGRSRDAADSIPLSTMFSSFARP